LRLAKAAVVATERAVQISTLDVEVVAKNGATVAQIGAQVEKVVVTASDDFHPEGHHLHEAARASARYGVFLETAFHLDETKHQLWVETRARRFVMHRAQEFETRFPVRNPLLEAP
jgi:hypothetical protein